MGKANWIRLNRGHLSGFDDIATQVVIYAMDRGGVGRISRRGHAILRGPNGGTMSVPKDGNRSQQSLELAVRKLFGTEPTKESQTPTLSTDEQIRKIQESIVDNPVLECLCPGCEATFVTEGARYTHHNEEHFPCREPGCFKVSPTSSAENAHHRIVHLGLHPRRGTGGKKKEKRVRMRPPRPAVESSTQVDASRPRRSQVGSFPNRILAYMREHPNREIPTAEIRQALGAEGDSVSVALHQGMHRTTKSDWGNVERVRRTVYRYNAPEVESSTVVEESETPPAPPSYNSDVTVRVRNLYDKVEDIHAYYLRERQELVEKLKAAEDEIARLRTMVERARNLLD